MDQPSFFDPPAEGKVLVKICGITRPADAVRIVSLGADAIGVNFWPRSKRFINFEAAESWLTDFENRVARIGVFVNESLDEIMRILDSGAIDAAQCHGDEPPEFIDELLGRGYQAFKAIGVRNDASLVRVPDFPGDLILLDAYAPADYGGTGETLDWRLGRDAVERWPDRRIILAGGLKPENVSSAIRQVQPFAVDVASGVESSPGKKDLEMVAAFLRESSH